MNILIKTIDKLTEQSFLSDAFDSLCLKRNIKIKVSVKIGENMNTARIYFNGLPYELEILIKIVKSKTT